MKFAAPNLFHTTAFGVAIATLALAPPAAATPDEGATIFRQRCQSCHSADAGKTSPLGPNLAGVVGRKAASTAFSYSAALKSSGLTWNRETLDSFLTAPARKVPGTRMVVSVPDAQQRAKLIAFLAGKPK